MSAEIVQQLIENHPSRADPMNRCQYDALAGYSVGCAVVEFLPLSPQAPRRGQELRLNAFCTSLVASLVVHDFSSAARLTSNEFLSSIVVFFGL